MITRKIEILGVEVRPWIIFIFEQYGSFLHSCEQHEKALDAAMKMYGFATKLYGPKHSLVLKIHGRLGKYYLENGNVPKALEHYETPAKILMDQEDPN